ncbi:hypothetical protein FBULB1_11251 [Fusarium bulbicola]|nr:hypothetical protein FBULB1_11251 [Fusarium bulbicola]
MAILRDLSLISVAVMIDGKPAQEYQHPCLPKPTYLDERQNLPEARCFIESQDGKAYMIRYRVSPLFFLSHSTDRLIIAVFVDGQLFGERVVLKTQVNNNLDYINVIQYGQRILPDGSSEWYGMMFKKVIMEEADQKTNEADLRRIKTLGNIEVVVRVAKGAANHPTALSPDDGVRNVSPAFSQKALVLNDLEKAHATNYPKIDGDFTLDSIPVQDVKSIGQFFFFYRPHEFLEHRNILDPCFANHDVHGMRHSAQDDRVSVMPNGRFLIDLTRSP